MVIFGIDAHKRTHTVVAVDETGRQLPAGRSRPPPPPISSCSAGPKRSTSSGCGRWRTAAMCRAAWNETCSAPANGSFGCPPS